MKQYKHYKKIRNGRTRIEIAERPLPMYPAINCYGFTFTLPNGDSLELSDAEAQKLVETFQQQIAKKKDDADYSRLDIEIAAVVNEYLNRARKAVDCGKHELIPQLARDIRDLFCGHEVAEVDIPAVEKFARRIISQRLREPGIEGLNMAIRSRLS